MLICSWVLLIIPSGGEWAVVVVDEADADQAALLVDGGDFAGEASFPRFAVFVVEEVHDCHEIDWLKGMAYGIDIHRSTYAVLTLAGAFTDTLPLQATVAAGDGQGNGFGDAFFTLQPGLHIHDDQIELLKEFDVTGLFVQVIFHIFPVELP